MKTHERSPTSAHLTPFTPIPHRRNWRRPNILIIIALLAILYCGTFLPLRIMTTIGPSPGSEAEHEYHQSREYSVVQGVFKQSDPDFNDKGYDLLNDSFGLVDQEGDRWRNFQRYVLF